MVQSAEAPLLLGGTLSSRGKWKKAWRGATQMMIVRRITGQPCQLVDRIHWIQRLELRPGILFFVHNANNVIIIMISLSKWGCSLGI